MNKKKLMYYIVNSLSVPPSMKIDNIRELTKEQIIKLYYQTYFSIVHAGQFEADGEHCYKEDMVSRYRKKYCPVCQADLTYLQINEGNPAYCPMCGFQIGGEFEPEEVNKIKEIIEQLNNNDKEEDGC